MIRKRTDLPGETSEPQETSQSGGPQHPPQRAPAPLQQKQYGDGSGSGGPQRPSQGELAPLQQQPQIGGGGVRAWGPWVQPQPQQQLQYRGGSESGCPQRPPQRAPVSMQQQQQIGGRGVRGWGPRAQPQQRSQYGHVGGTHQRGGLVSQYQGRGGPQQQPSVNQGRGGHPQQPSQFQGRGGPQPSGNPGRGWARPPQGVWGSQPAFSGRGAGPSTASSMRPPPPNLHQAQSSFSQPSSSSSSNTQNLSESFEKIYMQSPMPATSQAILPSSKALRFPLRPGTGTVGLKCIVKANHFIAELPDKELHQYDVSITPEVTSRGINRAVMNQLVMLHREKDLGGRLPAYDGRKSLYTAGPLPFFSHDFVITLLDEDDGSGAERRQRTFKIKINHTSQINLESLRGFLDGRQADVPQDTLQVLDIVLREGPTARKGFVPVGRSFFSADLGMKRQLGDGLESWGGFYQSIRPTQMGLSLNIDMSSCAFIEPLPVLEFVSQLLNRDITRFPLNSAESVKIKKTLRGVKVVVTHRGNMRRKYRINGLTTQPTRELTFPVDGVTTSVVQYFRETYGFPIQYINLPCLQVGNPQKPNYLPMEVCQIDEKQRYSKRLNEKQITALLKATCQHPKYRECAIKKTVETNAYNHDDHVLEFGLNISSKLAEVEARVLPAPLLKYHDSGSEKNVLPRDGQWNMRNKKLFNGARVNFWMCINFSRIQERGASKFCVELARMCNTSGMEFSLNPVLATHCAQNRSVEQVLSTQYRAAMGALQGRKLDLLIVILPDHNGSLYGDIKRICETNLGLVSQCCLNKHVLKCNPQYLANVALKINVKVGGRNTVLVDALSRNIPWVTDTTTIIFGADVSHPHPGEDSSPSIAAVVASQDWPHITKFVGRVSAQAHRQELIEDMYNVYEDPQRGVVHGGMIRELLISFMEANGGQKPQRIIFYRDGVSEGQFYQVLLHEVQAIRKACASLQYEQPPTITFVVVQKRHHTRLFAYDHADLGSVDRSGNILPGTVVDSRICHPTEFDFYLCSHAGIQGTSRPAHYHVLWDENNFTADGLQLLTNSMCYTYARCTRSVSIAPPAYYAHLAAFRARYYVQPETSGNGSTESLGPQQRATRVQNGVAVRPLPALSDDVKRVMFYC